MPMHEPTIVRSGKKMNSTGHPMAFARAVISFTSGLDRIVASVPTCMYLQVGVAMLPLIITSGWS